LGFLLDAFLGPSGLRYTILPPSYRAVEFYLRWRKNCQAVEVAADVVLQSWSLQIPNN